MADVKLQNEQHQQNKKWKKAIVTVAEGETIDLFNNV